MNPPMQCCRECRASLVDDYQSGEVVCPRCGIVAYDRMSDSGRESVMSLENGTARATGQSTYSRHDMGISGKIDAVSKDYSGKPINPSLLNQMQKLRTWQKRVQVSGSRERRLANILSSISDACDMLSLPRNVSETAAMIYRNLDYKINLKGMSVAAMTAAVIYMACKKCDVIHSIDAIAEKLSDIHQTRSKAKLAARYYRTLVMETGSPRSTLMPMERYISKISNICKMDVRVERLALGIAEKTRSPDFIDGKDPHGVAAAYLYIASSLLGGHIAQHDVPGAAGVTEVTIRNRCKEILSCCTITVTLKPQKTHQRGITGA